MKYLRMTITDTLGFWDNYLETYVFNADRGKTLTSWYRLPDDWTRDGALLPDRLEQLLRYRYGDAWRSGNGDGSRFVILKLDTHELTSSEVAQRPWERVREACYAVDADGEISGVDPSSL
jgi:hypothetical protein